MKNVSVSIVTPAYHEWDNLYEMALKIDSVLCDYESGSEWLIVCEAEPNEVQKNGLLNLSKFAKVLPRPLDNETFANAIEIGINHANVNNDLIVTMDGDQSHSPNTLTRLISAFDDEKHDVVIASRYVDGGTSNNSYLLKFMSKILNRVCAIFFGLKALDLSTNFKVFRRRDLLNLKLTSTNFEAVEELLLIVRHRRGTIRILEIPDSFYERKHGESKRKLGQFIGSYLVSLFVLARNVSKQN